MTAANVSCDFVEGDQVFYDKDKNIIMELDGTNRKLVIPSGSAVEVAGVTLSTTELAYLDGLTIGTVTASKAVVVDSNKDIGDFRNLDAVNVDAGASGTAGTVDVFPTTASKGKIQIAAADSAGDTTTTITNASQSGARTYTIPDAGASASFAMTEGAQTFNGVQTYTLPRVADHNTGITAFATGGQASATALTGEWNNVTTCATAGDSVKLPAAVAGQIITVKNSGATTLAVFPASGDAINALAGDLSVDIPPSAELTFRAIDSTTWETCEVLTLPSPTTQTGNLVFQAAASAGNTNTTITNASQAAARTYTIPDAGGNASFVMTEGTQTINGTKTIAALVTTNIDAGASGTAGSVDIFPTTASKGKIAITATDSTGDTTTAITNAAMAGARTFTITDPVASAASIHPSAVFVDGADGAISIKSGVVMLTKAGVEADTLAAPTAGADDGKTLTIIATTANAHTVTQASPGFNNAGAGGDVATFGGAVGDSMIITAYNGVWYTVSLRNVALS